MLKMIVVGSGAGGGTVARELSKFRVDVTLIDKGPFINSENASQYYETFTSNVEIMDTVCFGGTTMVTLGNAVRTCETTLKNLGINLEDEFESVEQELKVKPLPDSHIGMGTKKIMEASHKLGLNPHKMPKFIDPHLCKPCGECALGCKRDAKWTSVKYLKEAKESGVKIIDKTPVTEIITENGKVTGVKANNRKFPADIVILCAGAISTPRILIKSGIKAGENLFVDTFVTIGGVVKGINFNEEVQMNALIKLDDIILTPHYSSLLLDKLKNLKTGEKDILGIMVKIKDDPSGRVTEDAVIKYNTPRDVELLSRGSAIAGSILNEAGVDIRTLVSTPPRGAHPGGTAAIGEVVDENLETEISGLYVADASVFPEVPGAPPVPVSYTHLRRRRCKRVSCDLDHT